MVGCGGGHHADTTAPHNLRPVSLRSWRRRCSPTS